MTDKEKELVNIVRTAWLGASEIEADWLAAAKAARSWRDPDEFQNGDEIEYRSGEEWRSARFIGTDPRNASCAYIRIADGNLCWRIKDIRRPRKTVTKVKPLKDIVNWLVDNGYKPDEDGDWRRESGIVFNANMFANCGEIASKCWNWLPSWLEEVES